MWWRKSCHEKSQLLSLFINADCSYFCPRHFHFQNYPFCIAQRHSKQNKKVFMHRASTGRSLLLKICPKIAFQTGACTSFIQVRSVQRRGKNRLTSIWTIYPKPINYTNYNKKFLSMACPLPTNAVQEKKSQKIVFNINIHISYANYFTTLQFLTHCEMASRVLLPFI